MLRAGRGWVNASLMRNGRRSPHAKLVNDTRHVENLRTHLQIRAPQAVPPRMTVQAVQTCCGCARFAATIHLESQPLETLRQAAARERFLRRLAPAILVISNDAAPGRRWLPKMFSLEKAEPTRPPATPLRSRFGCAAQAPQQKRGYTRCSSPARRVSATLLSPRPAPGQLQERVRPNPYPTKATELLASASCAASTTKHKTSSQTDSKQHVPSPARKSQPQGFERGVIFSGFDYRRPAHNLAIEEGCGFSAVKTQIGRRCTPKDFQAAGRVR